MHKVCKIRIYPNSSQMDLINRTLGCCRFIKNKYIEFNQLAYKQNKEFISGYTFSKYLNQTKKNSPKYKWIQDYSSKAIKDAIMEEEKAFKKFFKRKKGFPKYKSRKRLNKESFFFVKNNIHLTENKYIIKIPILGKIRITEYNYIPDISTISSGRVILENNKYYISFIYEAKKKHTRLNHIKMGIDVGIKNFASIYISNGDKYKTLHFKNESKYKQIQEKIASLQRILSYKVEVNYIRKLNQYLDIHKEEPNDKTKNIMKGESYNTSGVRSIRRKINQLYKTITSIRLDRLRKFVSSIVTRIKPRIITIENLNVSDMLSKGNKDSNHTLRRYISISGFGLLKDMFIHKCNEWGIELRLADRYFASSKICSCCGKKKKTLSLVDRVFHCEYCGYEEDRDMNAAINLCNIKKNDYCIA